MSDQQHTNEDACGGSALTAVLEAKPCPFCGRPSEIHDDETLYPTGGWWREEEGLRHYVRHRERKEGDGRVWGMHCPEVYGGCGAEIKGDSKAEALEKWNRRASNNELTGGALAPSSDRRERG